MSATGWGLPCLSACHHVHCHLVPLGRVKDLGQVLGGRSRRGAVVDECLEWGAVAEGRVQTSAVVEDLDVLGDSEPGPRPGGEGPAVKIINGGRLEPC